MPQHTRRLGFMHTGWLVFLSSLVVLGGLVALLAWKPGRVPDEPLTVFCAAALRGPVEKIAKEYEAETGVPVQVQYGASQTLLTNLEVSRTGDLYIPADNSYLDLAQTKELIAETLPALQMSPALAVAKENPKGITSLSDLLSKEVRVCQANADAAAVGKMTRDILRKTGQWEALRKRTLVFKPTVNDVANDIKVGAVDAGIVWDATVIQYPELERIDTPEFAGQSAQVSVSVLQSTTQPAAALRFARFLTARDRGLTYFSSAGFRTIDGDPWAADPEVTLFAGAMLRPAIQDTITAFEEREGVTVGRKYDGCGILVAQLKAGEKPDVYFACDKSFMSEVADLFLDSIDVSTNQLVILVPKGNPHGIKALADLGKPGIKIGVGHEKQCALGALTQMTLSQSRLQDKVNKNVVVRVPAGDTLVNLLLVSAGSTSPDKALDAVVAYVSNAAAAGDKLEAIPIDIPCAIAVQPMALAKEARYPILTQRLLDKFQSHESKDRFLKLGFHWQPAAGAK